MPWWFHRNGLCAWCCRNTTEQDIFVGGRLAHPLKINIPPTQLKKRWTSSQGGMLYAGGGPKCLTRRPGSILISTRSGCKLFAQYVSLQFDSVLRLDSFTDGGGGLSGGPLCAHPHILNTCSGAEDGYSRHVKQWQGRWDHLGFFLFRFQGWLWNNTASKYSLSIYCIEDDGHTSASLFLCLTVIFFFLVFMGFFWLHYLKGH